MSTTRQDPIGTTIAGYRIERLLARGGMSVVYLACDIRLGRKVALKVLATDLSSDERFRGRFLRESRVAASLDHSHVIPIYEAGEADGLLYIAMRFVEGTELRTVIREGGPLPPEQAIEVVTQAASALDAAHARDLVHRDVKPGNILLADEGGGGARHVYLSDFGLTKQARSDSGLTETGQFVGTAEYIAPEQIEGDEVGPWSDVYALSCVLFECLTGEPPFRRDSLMALLWAHVHDAPPSASERRPGLPRAIDDVIARGMAKAPADRYETCGSLAEAAREALGLAPGTAPLSPVRRLAERPLFVLGTVAAAAAAIAIVLGLVLVGRGGDAAGRPTTALIRDSLQRIDPTTGRLAATVPQSSPIAELAVGDGSVWAVDDAGRYRRVDPTTNAVSATGSTAGEASGIDVGLGSVWIASREGSTATTGTVTQVDSRTGRATRVISVPVAQRVPNEPTFGDVEVDESVEAGRSLWVASPMSLALKRIRPRLGTVVSTVTTGDAAPRTLAVGEGGLWVTTWFRILRIDRNRNAIAARVDLPFDPRDVAAGAGAVWVVNGTGNSVWILDPETNRVVDRIPVGLEPVAVAVGAGSVWVANRRDGTVSRIDPERGAVTATIRVGGAPTDIAAGAEAVWVAALADRPYLAAVGAITARASGLGETALAPLWRLRARTVDFVDPVRVPAQLGHEVVAINRAQIAELSALEPPRRFAADHARYVEGLRELGRLHRQLAEKVERHDEDTDPIANEINSVAIELRSDLSPEFRAVVPHYPLACC
jgi:YVTN family beta-propeller protein